MATEFQVFLKRDHIGDALLDLNQLDGIQVRLPTKALPQPEIREHPFYSTSFPELTPIIISITSALTSFTSLAYAIYKLKRQGNKGTPKESSNQPAIVINQNIVYLSEFGSSEELAIYLEKILRNVKATEVERMEETEMVSILFLAADPTDATRLRLGEELREIQEKLQLGKNRDRFTLNQRMSVRPVDISQAVLDVSPQIVHFSGHGSATGEILFEDKVGRAQPVSSEALAAFFEQFSKQIQCVVLNACYSETQAQAIAQHIPYVIGMNHAIGDQAAIAFAIGFYQALGAGRTIEQAYNLGCIQIGLQGISGHLIPVLTKKKQVQL